MRRGPVRLPILIAAFTLGASAAVAQDAPTQLFVSPMGEPFRATASQPYPSAAWFAQADANHDGVITRSEFRADAERFFKTLDVNGDGKLNDMEMHRYEVLVAPEILSAVVDASQNDPVGKDFKGDPKQQTLSDVRQGAAYFGVIGDPEPVRSADGDFNMKVTLDEWMAAADRRFRILVGDNDGLKLSDLAKTPFQIQYETSHKKR